MDKDDMDRIAFFEDEVDFLRRQLAQRDEQIAKMQEDADESMRVGYAQAHRLESANEQLAAMKADKERAGEAFGSLAMWARDIVNAAAAEVEKHPSSDASAARNFIWWCDCPAQRDAFESLGIFRAYFKDGEG